MDCLVFLVSCQGEEAPFDVSKCGDKVFFIKEEAEEVCEKRNKIYNAKYYHVEEVIVARKRDTKYKDCPMDRIRRGRRSYRPDPG